MAGGGDKLCNYLADVKQTVRVEVIANKVSLPLLGYGLLTKTYSNLFYGADYDATSFENFHRNVYICQSHCSCWGGIQGISMKRTHLKNKVGSKKAIV